MTKKCCCQIPIVKDTLFTLRVYYYFICKNYIQTIKLIITLSVQNILTMSLHVTPLNDASFILSKIIIINLCNFFCNYILHGYQKEMIKIDILNIYKIINDIYINFKVKKIKLTNAWLIGK